MSKNTKKTKSHLALGFTLAGVAIGAGVAITAMLRQKQREQVYHEAEIKAMNELDDLMAETDCDCAACDCLDDCTEQCGDCTATEEQMDIFQEDDRPEILGETEPSENN